ncbi:transglycosylase family protein [Streptomyces sp. NBC_00687]|uniref:LysM peptidoglycan-binding domain-containing protein n=1 Tax=Streptomyces sp. NBC_00687 TaxID=2975807 RepID=UPI002252196C|nr:transglycosylase family protein [Streptomyces sp. NBC_00687]MCX4915183.1 LysM peptidoglycan-binding domain-containing protein [Streptomyces sp. NBC_00687]
MLSGNGRHRRPRQAPALIVAAGVTGSAIAIPLLGASSASAADGTTWDRVAECESGGAWSADSGNGYYGGLQLTQDNWERYGGLEYARSADQASRSQQIAVAEKVLDAQGLVAWPTCGPLSGLSKDSAGVDVDTGMGDGASDDAGDSGSSGLSTSPSASPSTESSRSSDSSGASDTASPKATESGTKSGGSQDANSSDKSDKSTSDASDSGKSGRSDASSEPSGDASTAAGRHRGGSADEDGADAATDSRADGTAGRHASRGSDDARDAGDGTYVVRSGDSLWKIADALDVTGGWADLYAANEKTVGIDPDLILPGQSLAVDSESVEK